MNFINTFGFKVYSDTLSEIPIVGNGCKTINTISPNSYGISTKDSEFKEALQKTDFLVLMLGGIKPSHQGIGLDVLMGIKMLESASQRGIKRINSHLELETNVKVRAEMEKMGGKACKNYRIYKKKMS